jgi:hypothetical protein
MTQAPRFRIASVERFERPVRFRIPFRFGGATVDRAPQAFVRVRIVLPDGTSSAGAAAEMMMPKWFDKSSAHSDADNVADLRESLATATEAYTADTTLRSAFDHHAEHYRSLLLSSAARGSNALTAGFGAALIDRAVLDALCRRERLSFCAAMRVNLAGIDGAALAPELRGFDLDTFLGELESRREVAVRHTVGLLDSLIAGDASARIGDGLPETLEEVIAVQQPRYFKVKVAGDPAADLERLLRIASILDRNGDHYRVTLDGNEQFDAVEPVVALWRAVVARRSLARFAASVLWIEQPLPRAVAGSTSVAVLARLVPVLIDESDATLDAFPLARALGYRGVSSKSCKGVYKPLLNAARCALWNATDDSPRSFLSGEDLTMQAGIAVQQDLALVGFLGLEHVERNGHHYVDGFTGQGAPEDEQRRFLAAHPDLYERGAGGARLAVRGGKLSFASLDAPELASRAEPDWASLDRVDTVAATAHS